MSAVLTSEPVAVRPDCIIVVKRNGKVVGRVTYRPEMSVYAILREGGAIGGWGLALAGKKVQILLNKNPARLLDIVQQPDSDEVTVELARKA